MSDSDSETNNIQKTLRDILKKSSRRPLATCPTPKDTKTASPGADKHSSPIPITSASSTSSPRPLFLFPPALRYPTVNVPGSSPRVATESISPLEYGKHLADDEVMIRVFLDRSPFFDHRASPRTMHVIDLPAYFQTNDTLLQQARPRLCDAVATILSHTSKECVEAFLDPAIKEFVYRREVERGGLVLIIRREGNEVICGAYVNCGSMLQWKMYVKSVINITGQWHEVHAITKPGMMRINDATPEWDVICADASEGKGEKAESMTVGISLRKLGLPQSRNKIDLGGNVDDTKLKVMLYQNRALARHLLSDIWYRFDTMEKCLATWAADGKEAQVQLKRELVGSRGDED
ncbi:hypothetical protein CC86DRAFT_437982 [Ophiobolus disseminans]|uniref:Uncharacterized protein n=1 Tax=Ophiobolus disseminans TaxID=1469910 RepID=A0A6A7A5N7_9PLEO|nr:hypothetical protein CC86DRAFT_437982 [Ophiobolus disseminans]